MSDGHSFAALNPNYVQKRNRIQNKAGLAGTTFE